MLPFAVSLLLVTLSPYFHFFLFSSSPHPFMGPSSLPLLTYSSFNQLPCSSPAVLCSFCCSSQWIFDAVKCVTGWETLAPPPHALSLCHFQSLHPSSFVSQSLALILQLSQLQCSDLSSLFLTWFTPPPLYLPALLPSFPITPLSLTSLIDYNMMVIL